MRTGSSYTRPSGAETPIHSGLPALGAPSDSTALQWYEMGVADAIAGVPDPAAESIDGPRQFAGRLLACAAERAAEITALAGTGMEALNEVTRLHALLPDEIDDAKERAHALRGHVSELPMGSDRLTARWRMTLLVLGIGASLPFEVYLNALALNFLDVSDGWAQRFLALGISLALAGAGVVASNTDRRPRRNLALWLVVVIVGGLALLRYGVLSEHTTWWEQAGGTLSLGAAAAVCALWSAFVHNNLSASGSEAEKWRMRALAERDLGSELSQLSLLRERWVGLGAEIGHHRDVAVTLIQAVPARFEGMANWWWAGYQQANRQSAPDIHIQVECLATQLRDQADKAVDQLDQKAAKATATLEVAEVARGMNGHSKDAIHV